MEYKAFHRTVWGWHGDHTGCHERQNDRQRGTLWGVTENNVGQGTVGMVWGQSTGSKETSYATRRGVWGQHGSSTGHHRGQWGNGADLEECDGGTVAHAEQEEGDEDGDGRPEPVQLPVQGLSTVVVQFQLWTERGSQCLSQQGVAGRESLCGKWVCMEAEEKGPAGLGQQTLPGASSQPQFPSTALRFARHNGPDRSLDCAKAFASPFIPQCRRKWQEQ